MQVGTAKGGPFLLFSGANLEKAKLKGANLEGANLWRANLTSTPSLNFTPVNVISRN